MEGQTLKKIECDPVCGFLIRSHDEKEVLKTAGHHIKKTHHMKVTDKDLRGKLKAA